MMKRLLFSVLIILLLATGCSQSLQFSVTQPPVISSFTASPGNITSGGSSTLNWDVSGASAVTIDQGIGNVDLTGTRVVSPGTTTTYVLTATNAGGSITATAQVVVEGLPQPPQPIAEPTRTQTLDLVITAVSASLIDDKIHYTIKNQGSAQADTISTMLFIDGIPQDNDYLSNLGPGEKRSCKFSYEYSCTGRSDSIEVVAQYIGPIPESNEDNNTFSTTLSCSSFQQGLRLELVPVPPPDLIITNIFVVGHTISYIIRNQGGKDCQQVTQTRLISATVNPAVYDSVNPLAKGESRTETLDYYYTCKGAGDIIILRADYEHQVQESNEDNNEYSELHYYNR